MLSAIYNKLTMFPTLHANDGAKQLFKPSELDIYHEPLEKEPTPRPPPSPVFLYKNVSIIRKKMTGTFSGLLTTHERITQTLTTTEDKIKSTYYQTLEDPSLLLTPGSIVLATLAGAIVAGKGKRPVKRSFYAFVFGVTAASVSYPQRALDTATTGYYHMSGAVSQLINSFQSVTSETKTITEKASETISPVIDIEDDNKALKNNDSGDKNSSQTELKIEETREVAIKSNTGDDNVKTDDVKTDGKDVTREFEFDAESTDAPTKVEGDIGQSNPDDADMYTTRS